jgi:hypothetical protein
LCAAGLDRLTRLLSPTDEARESALFRAGAALLLVCGLLSTLRMATLYGEMGGEVYRRDVAAARWIGANLPPGTTIANLATSVEYLTGHRNVNLHGVTSATFAGNRAAEREAGVFESLSRLPPGDRRAYLLTTASTQASLAALPELVDGAPLFQTTSFADEIQVFRMRYDLVGRSALPRLPQTLAAVAGKDEVDRLNVCDSADERSHGYSFESRLGNLRLHGTARVGTYASPDIPAEKVMDAGRVIMGGESFDVRTRPGRDLVAVLRTAAEASAVVFRAAGNGVLPLEIAEAGISVKVDGEDVARLGFRPRAGWDEAVLRVPGGAIRHERSRLTLSGRYAAYYYWFYQ